MAFVPATICNCKTASIRRAPWIPRFEFDEPSDVVEEKKLGEEIKIDKEDTCYDWHDRLYYRVANPKGWVHEGVVSVSERTSS